MPELANYLPQVADSTLALLRNCGEVNIVNMSIDNGSFFYAFLILKTRAPITSGSCETPQIAADILLDKVEGNLFDCCLEIEHERKYDRKPK